MFRVNFWVFFGWKQRSIFSFFFRIRGKNYSTLAKKHWQTKFFFFFIRMFIEWFFTHLSGLFSKLGKTVNKFCQNSSLHIQRIILKESDPILVKTQFFSGFRKKGIVFWRNIVGKKPRTEFHLKRGTFMGFDCFPKIERTSLKDEPNLQSLHQIRTHPEDDTTSINYWWR